MLDSETGGGEGVLAGKGLGHWVLQCGCGGVIRYQNWHGKRINISKKQPFVNGRP
jgi:hypothetical protein